MDCSSRHQPVHYLTKFERTHVRCYGYDSRKNKFPVGEVMVIKLFVPPLEMPTLAIQFAVIRLECRCIVCGSPQTSAIDISRRQPYSLTGL